MASTRFGGAHWPALSRHLATLRPPTASRIPHRIAVAAGICVSGTGFAVLLGWILDVAVAKSVLPDAPKMAPATALGFVLSGTALAWLAAAPTSRYWTLTRSRVAWALAATVTLLGLLKLGDYAFGWNLNFDTLGFRDTASVAPATALGFLLVGAALWLAPSVRHFRLFQALTLTAGLVGWLGLTGYFYGGEQLPAYAQMAVHTALLFFVVSLGVLCSRTDDGLMALLTSGTAGGRLSLWLLLLAAPLPLVLDSLRTAVGRAEWLSGANPMPLFASLDAVLLAALIWMAGTRLQRSDARRTEEEAKRRANEAQLQLFVEHAPAAIAMLDREMRYIAVSRRWLSDYRFDAKDVTGRSHYDVFPQTPKRWREIHRRCLAGAVEKREEDELRRGDGSVDWLHWEVHPWRQSNGEIGGIFLFSELITERKAAAQKIQRLNRVYATLSAINSLIVRVRDSQALFDEACKIAVELGNFGGAWIGLFNAATTEVTPMAGAGLKETDPLMANLDISESSPLAQCLPARAIRERRPVFDNDLSTGLARESERYREILDRGFRSVIALPLIVDGFAAGSISMWAKETDYFDDDELKLLTELANDVSFALEYLTKQEELDYVSYYDVLTGLPNRTLFLDRLSQQLREHGMRSPQVAVVLFDIERFRMVNETLGRHGGDDLLRSVARQLVEACDGKDNLARIGADGFAVAIRGTRDAADIAHEIENRILSCFRDSYTVNGTALRISAKVGLALYPADGRDADTLFRNAEAALKEAKLSGSGYVFYAAEMNAQAAQALALETRLREAVETREFVLHYQPKVKLDSGHLCGLEALIRWQNPEEGLIPPARFIPILEETGLISEVGRWALAETLSDYRNWTARGHPVPRIAVNVSAVQLRQDDFITMVIDLVRNAEVDPEALELEITESLVMQDMERSIHAFSILRSMGIHVTMDDFGTGYSSLSYLARLPIDKIKVDRSFIAGMTDNAQDKTVVSTVITLAHSFDLPVIAEGVETVEQAQTLHELGCDEAQGFLFSRPLSPAATGKLLATAGEGSFRRSGPSRP